MVKNLPKADFQSFVIQFPEIELPITLNTEMHHLFSSHNEPLEDSAIRAFIVANDQDPIDDYTEYVPCFRLENTDDFYAIVYWKAGLLTYEYFLVTFDKNGMLIDKKMIAGTKANKNELLHQIATIDIDWQIHIAGGEAKEEEDFDPTTSKVSYLELLDSGDIIEQYAL